MSTVPKPTAADRLRRTSPAAQAEVRAVSVGAPRVRPYKLTVNLHSAEYDGLLDFAHDHRLSHQAVLEALVRVLLRDASVAPG